MTDFELKLLKLLTILIKQGEATPEDACYVFKIEREVNKELGNDWQIYNS